ncbi:MAG: ABC transporter permease [Blastocatellia bacterium]
METLWQDIRYSFRMLRKSPGFTATAVLALALGIGANSAIFSVVNAVLLEPLLYPQPDRIVRLFIAGTSQSKEPVIKSVSYPDFVDLREQNSVFEEMAFIDGAGLTMADAAEPERLQCALVSASLFSLLGVEPVQGRAFTSEEDRPGGPPVVLLSYGLWQRRFGSSPDILNQTITLSRNSYTVIGVLPPNTKMPSDLTTGRSFDLWMPVMPSAYKRDRSMNRYEAYGRIKPGVTLKQAQTDVETIASGLEQQYQDSNKGKAIRILPLTDLVVRNSRATLLVLFGAVGFVLLIACANVANLMLSRATSRSKEIAIRAALGATRRRIVQQLLIESSMLALIGGAVGLLIALWSIDALVALQPVGLPRIDEIGINTVVAAFTLGLSLLTGLLFGLAPALQVSKPDLVTAIKEGTGSASASTNRVRRLLVISEVAMALVLLVGAGLLIKSFWRLQHVDPGINPANLLTFQISIPQTQYATDQQTKDFYQQLTGRLQSLPGVESAAAVNFLPLGGGFSCDSFTRDDRPFKPGEEPCVEYRSITSDYFRAMGIGLVSGRGFSDRDRQPVAIINEAMARRFWPGEDPVGMRLTPDTGEHVSREIIGVIKDIKHFGLDIETAPELYVPHFQDPWERQMTLVLRTSGDPLSLTAAVRSEVREMDKSLPVLNIRSMDQLLSRSVAEPRFRTLLLGGFAALALLLASLGIYGVISYSVSQRTREIGIRMALGAQTPDIVRMVVRQGLLLTLAGVTIGIACAFVLTRILLTGVLSSFLYQVSVTDTMIFVVIPLILMGVALGASFVPARRATKVDPMTALRYE